MRIIGYGNRKAVDDIIERSGLEFEDIKRVVDAILKDVRENGDVSLFKYTEEFDQFKLSEDNIRIRDDEIKDACSRLDGMVLKALKHAHRNISRFHSRQLEGIEREWSIEVDAGVTVGEKFFPIDSVGCYVPGGLASYPSTVLMGVIPAKIAGVERVVVVSPPPISDAILVACDICGVDEVYGVGGAQAIAALAYGTKSIRKVDKIIGPGNNYVMAAKMMVFGEVGIETPAGPSELLIIADETSNPGFIASDLLAQAEHDPDAQAIVVTDSREIAEEICEEVESQIRDLDRSEILERSLKQSAIILTENQEESIDFVNEYAAEHLLVMTEHPEETLGGIRNAGAIFLGDYSAVAAGDYASGANHILPTGGAARFSCGLGVRDFLRSASVQKISRQGLSSLRETIGVIAEAEGLIAHKKSVERRFL